MHGPPQPKSTCWAWYKHGEPDIFAQYIAASNAKLVPKYDVVGDNMLALIAQSPLGMHDLLLSDMAFVQQHNLADYIEEMSPGNYPSDDMPHEDFT